MQANKYSTYSRFPQVEALEGDKVVHFEEGILYYFMDMKFYIKIGSGKRMYVFVLAWGSPEHCLGSLEIGYFDLVKDIYSRAKVELGQMEEIYGVYRVEEVFGEEDIDANNAVLIEEDFYNSFESAKGALQGLFALGDRNTYTILPIWKLKGS